MLGYVAWISRWSLTLPLYVGVFETIGPSVQSTQASDNAKYAGRIWSIRPYAVVFDAGTCGLFFVSVPQLRFEALINAREEIDLKPAVIGCTVVEPIFRIIKKIRHITLVTCQE